MAKALLPKAAIKFLVDTYDCETQTYTFHEIREMISEKFNINVSSEALRRSYHRNKDSFPKNAPKTSDNTVIKSPQTVISEKPVKVFERPVQSSKTEGFKDDVAESLTKDEVNDLLK